ncbi:LCP family protein [Candidatus Saccharibacteria bacterium]|nr:LCP family protein [Candidatus Saccharibacteria bacterium]
MTNNKSIDGLTTHDAKISASNLSKPKTIKVKTSKTPKPKSTKPVSSAKSPKQSHPKTTPLPSTITPIPDSEITDLEIEVISESSTPTSTTQSPLSSPKSLDIKPAPKPKSKPKRTREQAVADFLSPVQAFNFDTENDKLTESEESIADMKTNHHSDQDAPLTKKEAKKQAKLAKKQAKKASKKKPSKTRRIITTISLIIVLGIIGVVIWGIIHINDILARFNGGNVFDLFTFASETYDPLKTDENGRTNILAFGTEGYDMSGTVGDGTHDGAQLTDSIMLISLDQETGDIAMVSLPRDLKASPTCTATGKINEVYWCNNMDGDNESAGATALMEEVGNILGVDIQYYVHINWGSLTSIVDKLGGIEVTLDEDIADYYYTGAVYEAGTTYTLDGEQALGLARARHGTANGDFTRGTSQQKIIIGIKNKVQEQSLSISDLLDFANILGDNFRTDLTMNELKTLAHIASDFDLDSVRTVTLLDPENDINYMTTATINGISYVIPSAGVGNYYSIQEYVTKMFSSDPRNYEDASIIILNSTDTAGLASDERATLTEAGYTITAIDGTIGNYTTKYTIYADQDQTPGTTKLLEEYYNTTANPISDLPSNAPQGYDIVIIIGSDSTDSN